MAGYCVWKCCEEEEEKKKEEECERAVVVQFSNGNLKNADRVDFSLYKNADSNNPRKKSRRIVVAETDRLSYVGSNFGTGSLKCNTLCKYYVGVLDKTTKCMEVHSAQLFSMKPLLPGESLPEDESSKSPAKSYRDKVDSLIEAFGTNKQKRALNSRKLNVVGKESLQNAMAKAASNIIDQKGVEALEQHVAEVEAQNDVMTHLPPCHADASQPEDVFPFDDLLSPVAYNALEEVGRKMAELSVDELQNSPKTVLLLLQNLPTDGEARERQARGTWYLSQLIKLSHQKKNINRKYGLEDGCPRVVQTNMLKTFTVEVFDNGRIKNVVSVSMRIKLAAYCLALLLHLGHMTVNLTLLHRDLAMKEGKMIEVAKSMGLRLSKQQVLESVSTELFTEHKMATLELPLIKYTPSGRVKKRKKMN